MAIPFYNNDDNNNERTPLEEQQLKLMFDLYVSLQNVLRIRHAQHTASRNRELYCDLLDDLLRYISKIIAVLMIDPTALEYRG